MTDRYAGAVFVPVKALLYCASLGYGLVIAARDILYRSGILKAVRVPLRVVSVGNIALGGTGKTPCTIMLARLMKDSLGTDPAILIRGYGWDEQAMVKAKVADIPLVVGKDRVVSCHKAVKLYGSDTAILDDGFQHRRLARDLDIVLVDAARPFGNGHLFPRGVLREGPRALGRAGVIVLTKADKQGASLEAAHAAVRRVNRTAAIIEAVHRPLGYYDMHVRKDLAVGYARGKRVILLSAIGDPEYFEETVRSLGAEVVEHCVYPDHHDYTARDIASVKRRCDERRFDLLITTEKDMVKLNRLGLHLSGYPVLALIIAMEITKGREALIDRLHSIAGD